MVLSFVVYRLSYRFSLTKPRRPAWLRNQILLSVPSDTVTAVCESTRAGMPSLDISFSLDGEARPFQSYRLSVSRLIEVLGQPGAILMLVQITTCVRYVVSASSFEPLLRH